ncbi:MAG: EscU/YscU/HrcU family type III secretion system export apparatus switch protein [Treponema sp.]|jgi:type III secretion system FlhB-like substrate exporter|nr:EscU/YscU/HrcU family type III secretion system export apparatus switch protein [Treponema sp.]
MKKRKTASALAYNKSRDPAPRLLVRGRDREAERIVAAAEKAGVAVVEDAALAALLNAGVNPGDFIPEWCWEAAARILAFVFEKDKKIR